MGEIENLIDVVREVVFEIHGPRAQRELQLTITKLQEARMWVDEAANVVML